ncbi:MAG: GxxExxY protein [Planctomycetota bacterium]|jgi:GxxExxY protein
MTTENEIGTIVVQEAIHIHRGLGPGLLESVYETVLERRLAKQGLVVQRQVPVQVRFEEDVFEEGFRADLIVNKKVLLELKSIEAINNVHRKQLLTYLRLTEIKLGYLLNFGEEVMKNGITRTINGRL